MKSLIAFAAVLMVGAGCSNQQPTSPNLEQTGDQMVSSDLNADQGGNVDLEAARRGFGFGFGHGHHHSEPVTFTVRIENVSDGMTLHLSNGETAPAPHSPGVYAVTRLFNPLFRIGRFDNGNGLEQQAEDGNPSMLAASLADNSRVKEYGVFSIPVGDTDPGPATPGKAFEFTVTASPGDRLSFTTMFGQSNDLFYAPGIVGIPLFWGRRPIHGDVTRFIRLWDAGTEVNQEPGLGPDQAPRQSGPNTGESEHKRILPVHDGYTYPRTNQVIKVTIMPAEGVS